MIELVIISFVAGILTVLAPCILPLLPVVVGGGSLHQEKEKTVSLKHPLIIIASLVASIVVFTLLLKFTTALIGIPSSFWSFLSGTIVFLFGINLLFPALWEIVMVRTGIATLSNRAMGNSQKQTGIKKDILLGAALGPVFNSCSPTYALIVAVILPVSFASGFIYLIAYSVGLGLMLLLAAVFGRAVTSKLKWASNPRGVFHKIIGILFITVGIFVVFGFDKRVQSYVLENGWYDPIIKFEQSFNLSTD